MLCVIAALCLHDFPILLLLLFVCFVFSPQRGTICASVKLTLRGVFLIIRYHSLAGGSGWPSAPTYPSLPQSIGRTKVHQEVSLSSEVAQQFGRVCMRRQDTGSKGHCFIALWLGQAHRPSWRTLGSTVPRSYILSPRVPTHPLAEGGERVQAFLVL